MNRKTGSQESRADIGERLDVLRVRDLDVAQEWFHIVEAKFSAEDAITRLRQTVLFEDFKIRLHQRASEMRKANGAKDDGVVRATPTDHTFVVDDDFSGSQGLTLKGLLSEMRPRARAYERARLILRRSAKSGQDLLAYSEAASAASMRTSKFLDTFSVFLPQRIIKEELGDFLEDIQRRAAKGQRPSKIYLRAAAAVFWVTVNTVGYLVKSLGLRKGA